MGICLIAPVTEMLWLNTKRGIVLGWNLSWYHFWTSQRAIYTE